MSQFEPPSTPPLSKIASSAPKKPFYKRKLLIAVLAISVLWKFGTLKSPKEDSITESGNKSNPTSTSTYVPSSIVQCIPIPSNVLADIASGEEAGVGMIPVDGYAV